MTNKEAINILRCSAVDSCDLCIENKKHGGDCDSQKDFYIALDKAIEALEKQERIESDIGNFSDGFHTFNSLYNQRVFLFATIVNQNKDKCWKTHHHEDGEKCFGGGWFLVTIETPDGAYGYHFEDPYWNLFDCIVLPKAKHWDGYTDKDVARLLSLNLEE